MIPDVWELVFVFTFVATLVRPEPSDDEAATTTPLVEAVPEVIMEPMEVEAFKT